MLELDGANTALSTISKRLEALPRRHQAVCRDVVLGAAPHA
jgi:hypothetical protein